MTISLNDEKDFYFNLGIVFIIFSAIFLGALQIFIKQLCMYKVHWAVNTIYSSYLGTPLTLTASILLYKFGYSHQNLDEEIELIPMHLFYSILSSLFGIARTVFLVLALNYEDPTKVAIARTSDVFFSFVLQLLILNISVDALSVIGSFAILFGTILVLGFKLVENKFRKGKNPENDNCCQKTLFFHF